MIKKNICGYFMMAIFGLGIVALALLLLIPSAVDSNSVRGSFAIYILLFILGFVKGIRYVRGHKTFGRQLPVIPDNSSLNIGTTDISRREFIYITAFAPDRLSLPVLYFITSVLVNLALGYRALWSDVLLPLLFAVVFIVLLRSMTVRGYRMLYPLSILAEDDGMRINGIYRLYWDDVHSISVRGDYLLIERVNIFENPLIVRDRQYIINGEEYSTAELLGAYVDRAAEKRKQGKKNPGE